MTSPTGIPRCPFPSPEELFLNWVADRADQYLVQIADLWPDMAWDRGRLLAARLASGSRWPGTARTADPAADPACR